MVFRRQDYFAAMTLEFAASVITSSNYDMTMSAHRQRFVQNHYELNHSHTRAQSNHSLIRKQWKSIQSFIKSTTLNKYAKNEINGINVLLRNYTRFLEYKRSVVHVITMAQLFVHRVQPHRIDAENVAVIVVKHPYKMRSCFERAYVLRKRINTKLTRKYENWAGRNLHIHLYTYICRAKLRSCRVISQYLFYLAYSPSFSSFAFFF